MRYSANVAGRDTREALARLDEAEALLREKDPSPGDPRDEFVARFIAPQREMGQHYFGKLQNVVHGDRPAFGLREFKMWLKENRGMTGFMLASPERQRLIRRLGDG
jgi:hypothetical protein